MYHYGALTSCKTLEKTNRQSLRYEKTNQGANKQTDRQGWLHRTVLDKLGSKISS